MMNSNDGNLTEIDESKQEQSPPNETGGIYFEGHIKIFDPETDEVLVNTRA